MHVVGAVHGGAHFGSHRDGGTARGVDQAIHPLEQVSCIKVISIVYGFIFVMKNNDKFLLLEKMLNFEKNMLYF